MTTRQQANFKILVTGGTGYIGSHSTVALQEAGFDVTIVDNLSNSFPEVIDGIEAITGIRPAFRKLDLTDGEELAALFREEGPFDGVLHFAALKAVGESVQQPLRYYRANIVALLNLLDNLAKSGNGKLVFSSSCTVYGQPDKLPVTEETPTKRPESPYGNSKKIAEEIIEDVLAVENIQAISLRYFNPVGAHPSARIGELPLGRPNNLIPVITQTAIGIQDHFTVFGDDYPTPDGTCIRDFIHVTDLARAHVNAVERLIKGENKEKVEVFNLGTGKGFSVLEVINTFERATGVKLNYSIGGRREGDIVEIYASTTKANEELGWKAQEGLESMIVSAWNWQKNIAVLYPNLVQR